MSEHVYKALMPAIALVAIAGVSTPAAAKIKCIGPFQVVRGVGEIATPYCEDNYLAKVARDYGVRVSASAIRNSPGKKDEVCRLVGHDHRVRNSCSGSRPEDHGNGN